MFLKLVSTVVHMRGVKTSPWQRVSLPFGTLESTPRCPEAEEALELAVQPAGLIWVAEELHCRAEDDGALAKGLSVIIICISQQ